MATAVQERVTRRGAPPAASCGERADVDDLGIHPHPISTVSFKVELWLHFRTSGGWESRPPLAGCELITAATIRPSQWRLRVIAATLRCCKVAAVNHGRHFRDLKVAAGSSRRHSNLPFEVHLSPFAGSRPVMMLRVKWGKTRLRQNKD